MRLRHHIITLILFVFFNNFLFCQDEIRIFGKITDTNQNPIELVNVSIKDYPYGTVTDINGDYEFYIPNIKQFLVIFSCIGYETKELVFDRNNPNLILFSYLELNGKLIQSLKKIDQVDITDQQYRKTNLVRINPKIINVIPDVSGNIEAVIKSLPGVSSNNELSSQYSVRGGNFDENLVYVNDIEVYRPLLIRSGQQEGLSFVNSDLVSSILFSAGGFDAIYGDKMSSVLDIKYKRPTKFGGSVSTSLLGASAHVEGTSKNLRFTHITGIRYKTSRYLLNSLDTKGEYSPDFFDFQTYLTYDVTDNFELSFLGNFSQNKYKFIPTIKKTIFGTVNEVLQLNMYFDGQEVDNFINFTGAVSGTYKPNKNLKLKFISSLYNSSENETYDIQSQYLINELDRDIGSSTMGDSIANIGIGTFLNHARNYLDAKVYNIYHKGEYATENNKLSWGMKYQHEIIDDNINEWEMHDSAGYSLPYNDSTVNLFYVLNSKNNIESNRIISYIQNSHQFNIKNTEFNFIAGLRFNYWDFNKEFLVSPRTSLSVKPNWKNDVMFRFALGYYNQPPFYKELRDLQGNINKDIKAQKSFHIVLGSDYNFTAWNRPFKYTTEVYYKFLSNLIPYNVDNVRIRYLGKNNAKGYAMGIDMKVNGEFVKGVDSWLSISLMQTEEDLNDDFYFVTDSLGNSTRVEPGYIPRPSDQLINIGLFFQDYLPGNPSYKMHLNILYGSRLPFGPPNSERYLATNRMPKPYRRVDIGFSKVLIKEGQRVRNKNPFHFFKSLWVSAEIFNLLQINNTISLIWVSDIRNHQYGIPNNLTSRRINIKLNGTF
ncbi:MAG: carboxypeptidase-like regulatory domain-containing protein [Bacteroidales bacterium]|nr:carboxypeptidase-like regulatory domain-containing protein [Bacteroidales bacterium]